VKAFPVRSQELRVIAIHDDGTLKQCVAWSMDAQRLNFWQVIKKNRKLSWPR
jgi:hypothetical protein